jgi:hypothetical protein
MTLPNDPLPNNPYVEAQRKKIIANKIEQKLETIKQYLLSVLHPRIKILGPNINIPQDPHLLIIGFSGDISIILKMRLTGTTITLAFSPMSRSAQDKIKFKNSMEQSFKEDVDIKTGNIFGKYMLVKNGNNKVEVIDYKELETIKSKLEMAIKKAVN